MEVVAKVLVIAIAVAVLLAGVYLGIRTASDPVWLVTWLNRLNGDPRDYPVEFRNQWWARLKQTNQNPDLVRASPFLSWRWRAFGITFAALSAAFLAYVLVIASR